MTNKTIAPVKPVGKAELYEEITGNVVDLTEARGPASLIRLHNADSYAYLACGMSSSLNSILVDSDRRANEIVAWYMNGYHFKASKFVLTPKANRPPASLVDHYKIEGGKKGT